MPIQTKRKVILPPKLRQEMKNEIVQLAIIKNSKISEIRRIKSEEIAAAKLKAQTSEANLRSEFEKDRQAIVDKYEELALAET